MPFNYEDKHLAKH